MQILTQNETNIQDIASLLKQGQTIVYPTETCYGLGCIAMSEEAVARIFDIKQRQKDKPLLVIASDISMMLAYVQWTMTLQKIAEKYWPGPVTVVVPISGKKLPKGIVGIDNTIAFRITDHPFASMLCNALQSPIVSTSANIASLKSPYSIAEVLTMFQDTKFQPDIIVDAGDLPHHSASTVVQVSNGKIRILRQGEVIVQL